MKKKKLFITPTYYSIGNAAEEIMWAYARARIVNKKLTIITPYNWTEILSYKLCNSELFQLTFGDNGALENESKVVRFVINSIFILKRITSRVTKKLFRISLSDHWNFPMIGQDSYWPYKKNKIFSENFNTLLADPIIFEINNFSAIELKLDTNISCENNLCKFGLKPESKFVCIHVRDAGFHKDGTKRPYRNADINTYIKSVNYLIDQGLYVFRMGDHSMSRMDVNNELFIDYPFTSLKSEAMDIFLIKNCEFYIGMQSGIFDVALLFNKPVLTLNMIDWFFCYPQKSCDRGLLKEISFKGQPKISNLKDRFALGFKATNSFSFVTMEDFMFVDNSSEQILSAVKEFFSDYKTGFLRPMASSLFIDNESFEKYSMKILSNSDPILAAGFHSFSNGRKTRMALRNLSARGALYSF